jgi:diguanylate cyclase (GGDEF)-like protein
MVAAPIPANEDQRVAELHGLHILDTGPERGYDDLVTITSSICGTPIGLVSLLDSDRQWFKARQGLDVSETPREVSFCAHAAADPSNLLVVPDALQDPRFSDNPRVTGEPHIRFYAGAPLVSPAGNVLGTLCVIDHQPRVLQPAQLDALQALSRQVVALLELRRTTRQLQRQLAEREWYEAQLERQQQELERRNADLTEQARTDPLTGLVNRRALDAALASAMEVSSPASGRTLALAFLDVDHFKTINDRYGHAMGDEVLRHFANVAGKLLRPADILGRIGGAAGVAARFGGDEFALMLPNVSADAVELQCEYLCTEVAHELIELQASISVGVAMLHAGETPRDFCVRADAALYQAKEGGRNRTVVLR